MAPLLVGQKRNAVVNPGYIQSWLHSVPRSQFLRLRRNCSDVNTYLVEAPTLKERFIEKGYDPVLVTSELNKGAGIDRSSLLVKKPPREQDNSFKCSMLTTFSLQHRENKNIIRRHWDRLRNDRVLKTVLPEQPKVIFRGVSSLRGKIAPNTINPPTRSSFFHYLVGYFPCRKCTVCQYNSCGGRKSLEYKSNVTNRVYPI